MLFWAAQEVSLEKQTLLKVELLKTYFCLAVDLDDQQNLLNAIFRAGLDPIRARQVLEGNEFAQNVRDEEQRYQKLGIHSVPSIILNDQYLVQGAQPPESFVSVFEQLLEQTDQ